MTKPNILLITCDQWRGDSLSAAGHPVVRTPHADSLAAAGVIFRRHYANAAPCSPARACLYTGLYQMTNRVVRNGTPLDNRHGNIALAFRRLGYDPTLFGYTDVSLDPRLYAPDDPFMITYESVLPGFSPRSLLPGHHKPWLSWLAARGVDTSGGFATVNMPRGGISGRVTNAPPAYSADETPGAYLAGEFVRWLGEQDAATPWFAHISLISPHPPFVVPEPYNTLYNPDEGPAFARLPHRAAEADSHPFLAYVLNRQVKASFLPGMAGNAADFDEHDLRQIRALYWGMVSETDAQLGRMWAALKAHGAWKDTIIVLTSDHAEMLGDHHLLGKGGFFDQSYNVPLIVKPAEGTIPPGSSVEAFTESVDILPTLLDLAGSTPAPHLDGMSFKSLMEDPTTAWRQEAHWEFDFRSVEKGNAERHFGLSPRECNLAVIRGDTFKYVHFGGGLPPLLYRIDEDPGELRNIADDPAWLKTRLDCAEALLAWRARHLDQSLALSQLTREGVAGHAVGLTR